MTWTWRNGSHLEGKLPVCACSVTSFDRTHCRPEKDFLGNGWKLELVVSYKPADLDFKPSVKVKSLQVDCTLAPIPRYVPTTTRKFRVEKETYRTSHNGATTVLDKEGTVEAMNPTRGIYRDEKWRGPFKTSRGSEKRIEYRTNIYIPIHTFQILTTTTTNQKNEYSTY